MTGVMYPAAVSCSGGTHVFYYSGNSTDGPLVGTPCECGKTLYAKPITCATCGQVVNKKNEKEKTGNA